MKSDQHKHDAEGKLNKDGSLVCFGKLRDAMAVDSLEPGGIYFGTTGGQVAIVAAKRPRN